MELTPWSVRRMRQWLRHDLESHGVPHAPLSADLLLGNALGVTRTQLYMRAPDEVLDEGALRAIRERLVRIRRREPIQLVLGEWSFRGIPLEVSGCTLIPRGATEALVEAAKSALSGWLSQAPPATACTIRVLDIGTGTGCIPIALLRELRGGTARTESTLPWSMEAATAETPPPLATIDLEGEVVDSVPQLDRAELRAVATDIVPEALELASRNAQRSGVSRHMEFRLGSVWEPIPQGERFHVIVSNPPYIADGEWDALAPEVREHEPATALRGGPTGLRFLRPIILGAPKRLVGGGALIVECGTGQSEPVKALAAEAGFGTAAILDDEDGLPRVLVAHLGGGPPVAERLGDIRQEV
ncbi:MAG: peptide chain release factor N(5)-glutamine methyltransferase [Planctomycetota bacterium]|nr:peptide chain release factor N(5)-glutamine methyltransferase [Planctomycetota bacterium]MDA1106637.1 peptide chain release factor N(5)-glutamine methyltransferase [Planctomycetota bacterium]